MPEIAAPIALRPRLRPSLAERTRAYLRALVSRQPTRDGSVFLLDKDGDVWKPRDEGWMLCIRVRNGRIVPSNHPLPYEFVARQYGPLLRIPGDVA